MANDSKKAETTGDAQKALSPNGQPDGPGTPGDEPKVGKVEARLAALEAYVKHNVKTLGWPEFKG